MVAEVRRGEAPESPMHLRKTECERVFTASFSPKASAHRDFSNSRNFVCLLAAATAAAPASHIFATYLLACLGLSESAMMIIRCQLLHVD